MKVLFLTKMIDYFLQRIEDLKKEFSSDFFIVPKNREEAQKHIEDADVIVSGSLTKEQVLNAKKLKFVLVPWAGVNGLPLDLLDERNIIIANNH
ncbi:2-hydroxyacid dehydrogenase, partial [Fervidobacterium sp. SC_NGM5_O18]